MNKKEVPSIKSDEPELRLTIIGLGHLMSAIWPCMIKAVGRDNLAARVNAVTGDAEEAEIRQKQFGISVNVGNNICALKSMSPDIIFFAPPPNLALKIIREELKAYFDELRSRSAPLPEIYAFPPTPPGRVYQEILSIDVLVVNLLPGPLREIGGIPVQIPTLAAFASPWPDKALERLRRIWSEWGGLSEFSSHQKLIRHLSCVVMAVALPEFIIIIADTLVQSGQALVHTRIAEYFRAWMQQITDYETPGSPSSTRDVVTDPLRTFLDTLAEAYFEGLMDYMQESGVSRKLATTQIAPALDRMLWLAQVENKTHIQNHTNATATKGGLVELSIDCLNRDIGPIIRQVSDRWHNTPNEKWKNKLRNMIRQTTHAVYDLGWKLSA